LGKPTGADPSPVKYTQLAASAHVGNWHRADDFGAAARLSVVGGAADPLIAAIPLPQLTPERPSVRAQGRIAVHHPSPVLRKELGSFR
jgi:hypothetical protein